MRFAKVGGCGVVTANPQGVHSVMQEIALRRECIGAERCSGEVLRCVS